MASSSGASASAPPASDPPASPTYSPQQQQQQLKEINAKGARAYDAFCGARDEWEILDAEYGSEDEDTVKAKEAAIQAHAELEKANDEFVQFFEKEKKNVFSDMNA